MKVTQLCPTLCNPMDYTVHVILQARILEWVSFLSLLQGFFPTALKIEEGGMWCPKDERTGQAGGRQQGRPWNAGMEKSRCLLSFPLPLRVLAINEFQVLLSSITCLPSYPIGRRYLPFSSPTQYMCLIQSANDPQDPYPAPCTLGIKMDQGSPFNIGSLLSWPAVLIASPTVINFILLSCCLMSGNSFPTCAQTMTGKTEGMRRRGQQRMRWLDGIIV